MPRVLVSSLAAVVLLAWGLLAQERIQQGTIKKVDASRNVIVVTVDGEDREFTVPENARFGDGSPDGLKSLKEGSEVQFRTSDRGGKTFVTALRFRGQEGNQAGGVRRAVVKKIDLDGKVLTLTVDGKDQEFHLTDNTPVLGVQGKDLKERFQGIKEGTPIFFRAETRDGKAVLVCVKPAEGAPAEQNRRQQPKADTSKLKPLPELGAEEYQGFPGGLYPGGKNERPADHEAAGRELAKQVRPLDADGKPSPSGKVVLLSVGMSNTSQSSQGFQKQLAAESDKNPNLLFVNGAQGGMTAAAIQDPEDGRTGRKYWDEVDNRLKQAGVTRAQVQAVWIKQADAGPSQGFPGYAKKLQQELTKIVQLLPQRFPNLKLVYLSGRTYGGYATTSLNPEPYAYESGFSVKWLIEEQLKGDPALNYDPKKGAVKAPWLSWGPYLWANGTTKRADGFSYEQRDFAGDGTHQSPSGQEKVGKLLLQFFKTDSTTRPWFGRG